MIYKRKSEFVVYRYLLLNAIPIILLTVINDSNYIFIIGFMILINIIFVISELNFLNAYKILVEKGVVVFYCFNRFSIKKINCTKDELSYSYRYEVGSKGVKGLEFRVYCNKKRIVNGMGRGLDGWTENIIEEVISEFKKIGIKEV